MFSCGHLPADMVMMMKCHFLTFTRTNNPAEYTHNINTVELKREAVVIVMGVWIDLNLSFRPHYDYLVSK